MAIAPPITQETTAKPAAEPGIKRAGTLERGLQVVAYVVLTAFALLMFIPFWFSVATSLKPDAETIRIGWGNMFWPDNPTLASYRTVFDSDIGRWFANSTFIAAIWIIGRAISASMAGYAFARMKFPGRDIVFIMVISTMMIPPMVTIIPKYIFLQEVGLINTYGAMTLPFLSDAFTIFLMKQFFETFPGEIEEAARVDGASRYRIFAQVVLPNAWPALAALMIFTFQGSWNEFLQMVIYISDPDLYTLPLGLAYFYRANYTDWNLVMAIAVITTVPIAIFFLIFQRYFVASNATSGIKG